MAFQFALICSTGMPTREALCYFLPEDELDHGVVDRTLERWMRSKVVQEAIDAVQGKSWQVMQPMERVRFALDKTYNEMAYFLYSRNYTELSGPEKAKADTCRVALEAKLAGTAGQLGQMERFWDDVLAGRVRLGAPPPIRQVAAE